MNNVCNIGRLKQVFKKKVDKAGINSFLNISIIQNRYRRLKLYNKAQAIDRSSSIIVENDQKLHQSFKKRILILVNTFSLSQLLKIYLYIYHMITKLTSYYKNAFLKITSSMIRQTGLFLYIRGSDITKDCSWIQPLSRHRIINQFNGQIPIVSDKATLSPTCTLIGPVYVSKFSKIWYDVHLRAENSVIRIGQNCQIQDYAILKTNRNRVSQTCQSITLGNRVIVGPYSIIGSTIIDDDVFIGARSYIGDGCKIQRGVVIAPNSVIPPGSLLPGYTYWSGTPARFVKDLNQQERKQMIEGNKAN